jgi:hypothetical protein
MGLPFAGGREALPVPGRGGAEGMEVLILLTLLIALDLAAWRWGHDSRDGHSGTGGVGR